MVEAVGLRHGGGGARRSDRRQRRRTAIRLQKELIIRWRESDLAAAVRAGIPAFAAAYATGEPREGATAFLEKRRAALRGAPLKIRAITVDFWGTLLLDPPSSDNRYKRRRMADFESLLAGMRA